MCNRRYFTVCIPELDKNLQFTIIDTVLWCLLTFSTNKNFEKLHQPSDNGDQNIKKIIFVKEHLLHIKRQRSSLIEMIVL